MTPKRMKSNISATKNSTAVTRFFISFWRLKVSSCLVLGLGMPCRTLAYVAVLSRRIYRSQTNRREPPIYSARRFLPINSRKSIS